MSRSEQLSTRLRELFLNGKWIANTNVKELLLSINYQQANCKVAELNTIIELTFHINYYLSGLLQVLNGGPLEVRDKLSFDMRPITTEAQWQQLVNTLVSNAEAFANATETLTDAQLDAPFVDEKYGTYLRNIEAIIEHSYYHFGQISILKKLTV
ncbi:MAG: hypothetical protein RL226_1937 [Bacteroidota bacterium]|jgi:hypothetical protein